MRQLLVQSALVEHPELNRIMLHEPTADSTRLRLIVGAASLPFVNAPEACLLAGIDPMEPSWVERHTDGLIATLLPGWKQS